MPLQPYVPLASLMPLQSYVPLASLMQNHMYPKIKHHKKVFYHKKHAPGAA